MAIFGIMLKAIVAIALLFAVSLFISLLYKEGEILEQLKYSDKE